MRVHPCTIGRAVMSVGLRSWRHVRDGEHLFTRFDQSELTASFVLNRLWIVLEPLEPLDEPLVFQLCRVEPGLRHTKVLTGARHRDQTTFAHQRICQQEASDDDEHRLDAAPAFSWRHASWRDGDRRAAFHHRHSRTRSRMRPATRPKTRSSHAD